MLSVTTLAGELAAMPETLDEAEAAENLANAWNNYFLESTVAAVPAIPTTLEPARLAMQTALAGMSVPGAGAAVFVGALAAYWAAVSVAAVSIWVVVPPLASVTPPPGLLTVIPLLVPVLLANTIAGLSKADSCAAIATVLHANVGLTGLAVNTASPPITIPIL